MHNSSQLTAVGILALILFVPDPARAQAINLDSAPPFPEAPTLKDLDKWLKRELPKMGNDSVVTRGANGQQWGMKYTVAKVDLTGCTLSYQVLEGLDFVVSRPSLTWTVPLAELDLGKLRVIEVPQVTGYTTSKPFFKMLLTSRHDSGFTVQSMGYAGGPTTRRIRSADMPVRDRYMSVQPIAALRRAAVLCGTPNVSAIVAEVATEPQVKQGESQGSRKLTNKDVVAMVSAGLSESVVVTAVRQATGRDFDVTPDGLIALKTAHVPDAVVSAMLAPPLPQPGAAAPGTSMPRYDSTLAILKPPPPPPGCSGVESLDTFRNDALPAAMGGVVEWLGKVRNNNAGARIVTVAWTDMYGQTKQNSVQVAGGAIATLRLDLTQPRAIAPVSNFHLISCQ